MKQTERDIMELFAQGIDDLEEIADHLDLSVIRAEFHLDNLHDEGLVEPGLFGEWVLTREGRAYIVKHDLDL